MTENRPLISIVTPCLNRAGMIREALDSVRNQNYAHVEHIIVDGGSTDGTLEILKEYQEKYPDLKIISEPDKNLYDALNKGIRLAKGGVIGHLNSDDCYEKNCFYNIVDCFINHPEADSVCGGASVFEWRNPPFRPEELQKVTDKEKTLKALFNQLRYKKLSLTNITYGMPIINARFFRKSVYDRLGLYDIQYRIAADREFLLRAYIGNIKTVYLDKIIYHYQLHPGSLTINNLASDLNDEINPEYLQVLNQYSHKSNLAPEVYRACRDWKTWMLGYNMLRYIKALDFMSVLRMMRKGYAHDKFFILRYMMQMIKHRSSIFCQ